MLTSLLCLTALVPCLGSEPSESAAGGRPAAVVLTDSFDAGVARPRTLLELPGLNLPGKGLARRARLWADSWQAHSAAIGSGHPERVQATFEYLLWWIEDPASPPLVTTSPDGTPFGEAGVLGQPTTAILFGGKDIDFDAHTGGRATFTSWLGPGHTLALQGSAFLLETTAVHFSAASDEQGSPPLARPFRSAFGGGEQAVLVSFPGPPEPALAGGIAISTSSYMWGGEVNLTGPVRGPNFYRLDFLLGFRYLEFGEDLDIAQRTDVLPGGVTGFLGMPVQFPDGVFVTDVFETRNYFFGGQVGCQAGVDYGQFSADVIAKLAFGSTMQVIRTRGSTTLLTDAGPAGQTLAGMLVLPSNSGRLDGDDFILLPEIQLRLGIQLSPSVRAYVSYHCLFWHDVVRATEQIDRIVNVTQLPTSLAYAPVIGDPRPMPLMDKTGVWVQGISGGLTIRY